MITVYLGLSVYYLSSVLIFSIEHTGPYPHQRKEIAIGTFDEITKDRGFIKRPVGLFDYLRRLFGAYSVTKDSDGHEVWIVHINRIAVWQCPHCLGFWVAFVVALFAALWYQNPQDFFINWFASAGINSVLVRILQRES